MPDGRLAVLHTGGARVSFSRRSDEYCGAGVPGGSSATRCTAAGRPGCRHRMHRTEGAVDAQTRQKRSGSVSRRSAPRPAWSPKWGRWSGRPPASSASRPRTRSSRPPGGPTAAGDPAGRPRVRAGGPQRPRRAAGAKSSPPPDAYPGERRTSPQRKSGRVRRSYGRGAGAGRSSTGAPAAPPIHDTLRRCARWRSRITRMDRAPRARPWRSGG